MIEIKKEFKELIPALTAEEYAGLEASVLNEGCRDSIITWNDIIIDGHNRYEICSNHNIPFNIIKMDFEDEDIVIKWIINNQLSRRNLNTDQRIILLGQQYNNENKGARTDISQISVKSSIDNLPSGKIYRSVTKEQQRSPKGQFAPSVNVAKKIAEENNISEKTVRNYGKIAMEFEKLKEQQPELAKDILDGKKSFKDIKKNEKIEKRKELAEIGSKKELTIDFRLGDFETILADIPDGSVDCIITDPPYPLEFIECWSKLSKFAKRVLKPNGFCIAYSGQMHLPEVINRMQEHLDYYWTFAVYHKCNTQIVNGVNLMCRWKPVLIFQNGKKKIDHVFQDYFISEQTEKDDHDWQQSESGAYYLIDKFTIEGDMICDPFAGSGTTVKAAIDKGRRIIAAEINEETYNIAKSKL